MKERGQANNGTGQPSIIPTTAGNGTSMYCMSMSLGDAQMMTVSPIQSPVSTMMVMMSSGCPIWRCAPRMVHNGRLIQQSSFYIFLRSAVLCVDVELIRSEELRPTLELSRGCSLRSGHKRSCSGRAWTRRLMQFVASDGVGISDRQLVAPMMPFPPLQASRLSPAAQPLYSNSVLTALAFIPSKVTAVAHVSCSKSKMSAQTDYTADRDQELPDGKYSAGHKDDRARTSRAVPNRDAAPKAPYKVVMETTDNVWQPPSGKQFRTVMRTIG